MQQTQQTIRKMQRDQATKQKEADVIERSLDEKTSLLKVKQTELDQNELPVMIDQMHLGEFLKATTL